jgi:hypothetical protein
MDTSRKTSSIKTQEMVGGCTILGDIERINRRGERLGGAGMDRTAVSELEASSWILKGEASFAHYCRTLSPGTTDRQLP